MEEHHVQHLLIGELDKMQDDDPEFDAKFTVLAENTRHHIREEESEMLPQAQKTMDHDLLMDLGSKMMEKKEQMQKSGV